MSDLLTSGSRGSARGTPPRKAAPPAAPQGRQPRPEVRRRSRVLTGIGVALAAAAAGLLLVEAVALICWIAETRSAAPLGVALRTGAAFWLLGNGGRLHLPAGTAALIPLGLSILFFAFASRSGASVARVRPAGPRHRTVLACALAVGVPYALICALVAGITSGGGLRPSVVSALFGAFALGFAGAAVGAARELPMAAPRPSAARAIVSGTGVAAGAFFAVCALLAAGAILLHLSDVDALARPARAGAVGGFGLLTLQAALAPNVIVWTGAYLLGPGFAVGVGTTVSPTGVHLGDVPGLPMLAGLPSGGAPWPFYLLFLMAPAAGVLGGVVAVRRMPRTPRLPVALLLGGGIAAAMAASAFVAAALSGGSVTRGRLATVGPSPWQTALAAGLEIGVPAVLAALSLTWYRQRTQRHRLADSVAAAPTAESEDVSPGRWQRVRARARVPGMGKARRLTAVGLSAGRGLGTGLGLDRLRRREDRAAPEPVDLVKVQRERVDLIKRVSLIKEEPPASPGQPGGSRRRLLHRPRLPKRLRRKSKVIKLPD
jgi:Family of unknown function (DUF6350)